MPDSSPALKKEESDMVQAPWSKSTVLTIMSALQLQGYQQHLTFGAFHKLVLTKIDFPKEPTKESLESSVTTPATETYGWHEQRLVEFMAAAYPDVYSPQRIPYSTAFPGSQHKNIDKKVWCLVLVSPGMSAPQRLQLLQQRLKDSKITKDTLRHIHECVEAYRSEMKAIKGPKLQPENQSTEDAQQASQEPSASKATADQQQASTIDERVKAKAEAKRKRQQEEEAIQSSPRAVRGDAPWLVSVANTLWSKHKANNLLKQKRLQSYLTTDVKRKNQSSWSLTDALALLATKFPRTKRRALWDALQQIQRVAPEWLTVDMVTESNGKTDPKASTVTLQGSAGSLEKVVARITGKKAAVQSRPSLTVTAKSPRTIQTEKIPPVSAVWRQSTVVTQNPSPVQPHVREPSRKRCAPETTTAPNKSLRINPNLILTDADHKGGEILDVQRLKSPRGLKGLFQRMNSGERI